MNPAPVRPRIPDYGRHLLVCVGERCTEDGMTPAELNNVVRKLTAAGLLQPGALRVKPSRVNCLGACGSGPVMCVHPDGVWYFDVQPPHLDRIIDEHLVGGRVVEEFVFHRGPRSRDGIPQPARDDGDAQAA